MKCVKMSAFAWIYFFGIVCLNVTFLGNVMAVTTTAMPRTTTIPTTTNDIGQATKYTCQPNPILVNISTDQPVNSYINIPITCSNWRNTSSIVFVLELTFDESLHFDTDKSYSSNGVLLRLKLINRIELNYQRNTSITVYEDDTKTTKLNIIPIEIRTLPPPQIHPAALSEVIREDALSGSIIGIFNRTDPVTGEGIAIRYVKDLGMPKDIPKDIEIQNVNGTVQLKTSKALDADTYINYSQSDGLDVGSSALGPKIRFSFLVIDMIGLVANVNVTLTIVDVGDSNPKCSNTNITEKISPWNLVPKFVVTKLLGNCFGSNYKSKTVSYSLKDDKCQGFKITGSGNVIVNSPIASNRTFCSLVAQATDDVYKKLTTNITISIHIIYCPADTDYYGNDWERGNPGNKTVKQCPQGYTGIVTRYCNEDGKYQHPVYNCTSSTINHIFEEIIGKDNNGSADISEVLDKLANATSFTDENSTLLIGDMDTINKVLAKVTDLVIVNNTNVDGIANSFMDTVDNILDVNTTATWEVMINETGSGADSVLENIDRFVDKMVSNTNTTILLPKTNLYVKTESISSCGSDVHFPRRGTDEVPEWADITQDQLVVGCSNQVEAFSGVMYRNLSKIIPSRTANNESVSLMLNAPVMSFTFYPLMQRTLTNEVEITFQLYNKNWVNASCSFWKKTNSSPGFWSEDGCRRKRDDNNADSVVCVCDHLTNFAVLMTPASASMANADHNIALSIISMVGCIFSMICLFVTAAVHVYFWKFVKSVKSILHINLSCTLFLAYAVFLAGINRTEIKVVCTVIAAVLHLLYLIVFFVMLTEGFHLAYTVLKPLSRRKIGIPVLIASYVLAVVIVAVSMGVVQMEGYGNEKFCWLSTESGLIWAFVGPVLVIITINFIVMFLVLCTFFKTSAMAKRSNTEKTRAAVRSILILMPLMGVTWMFGVFSVNEETLVFQYLFAIFNSIQGVLIFICHCAMNKKIQEAYRRQKWKLLSTFSSGTSEAPRNLRTQVSNPKTQTSTVL